MRLQSSKLVRTHAKDQGCLTLHSRGTCQTRCGLPLTLNAFALYDANQTNRSHSEDGSAAHAATIWLGIGGAFCRARRGSPVYTAGSLCHGSGLRCCRHVVRLSNQPSHRGSRQSVNHSQSCGWLCHHSSGRPLVGRLHVPCRRPGGTLWRLAIRVQTFGLEACRGRVQGHDLLAPRCYVACACSGRSRCHAPALYPNLESE